MKLAVLMAVFNNADTLENSIKSILNQTVKNFQFVIVNDASTDKSHEILSKYQRLDSRINLIKNKHQLGLTKSLNKGLKIIKAKYIARMDADDSSLPKRFEKQLKYLETHPKIALLGTAAFLIDQNGKKLKLRTNPIDHQHIKKVALRYCPFIHPTWMIRRSALLDLNFYNENFPFAQDYELVLRLMTQHQTANLPEPLLKYRVNYSKAISLKNLKTQERLAIKARFLALTQYGYPVSQSWQLIKPFFSYLIPSFIKIPIYQKFFWDLTLKP
jgi:glycosyltransferase involved in cell wall biosynthesis